MRKPAVCPAQPVASRVNPSFILGTFALGDVHRAHGFGAQHTLGAAALANGEDSDQP